MKLARYAPDDINTDRKKQRRFIKGFNSNFREQIVTHVYPDFNTLMNRTILLEEEHNKTEGERKRKLLIQQLRQQDKTQRVRYNNTAPTKFQSTMQYKSSGSNTSQTMSNFRRNTSSNNGSSNSQSRNNITPTVDACFGCGQPGHRIAQYRYQNKNSAPTQSVASNRLTASGVGRNAPQNSGPHKKNAQTFGQGRVNHINAEEVQAVSDVVYGEFLINSISATMLFDSGASHSFISTCFAHKKF